MSLRNLKFTWEQLGDIDPLWAIVAHPDKKGNQWKESEFFETGKRAVSVIMDRAKTLGAAIEKGVALDFGCGVGRITQALASYFDKVIGVDISRSMLKKAEALNQWQDRCEYRLNTSNDLRQFADSCFDFALSLIVFQHMQPKIACRYIEEIIRTLKPGGIFIFQLPSHKKKTLGERNLDYHQLKRIVLEMAPLFLLRVYRRIRKKVVVEMFAIRKDKVINFLSSNNCMIINVEEDNMAGEEWHSYTYYVMKQNTN